VRAEVVCAWHRRRARMCCGTTRVWCRSKCLLCHAPWHC
jgi:hypothetical protein